MSLKAYVASTSRIPLLLIEEACAASGIAVVPMDSEATVFDELKATLPDVVFLQAAIVEGAEHDLVARIKEDPDLGDAFVYIHASRSEGAEFSARVGADGFIRVPFSRGQMEALLRLVFGRPRKLLLVSAADAEVEALQQALEHEGFELEVARSERDGLAASHEGMPDMVIADLDLPDGSGLGLCGQVKDDLLLRQLPVVLLARDGSAQAVERCFDSGASDVLLPPFESERNLAALAAVARPPRRGRKGKALVVDDSSAVRNIISKMFRQLGFSVVTAEDGREGLEVARRELPDIITSDYEMPVMTGWDFCRELKADEELRHLPVIMVTSLQSDVDRKKGELLGVDAYLAKPFTADDLQEAVVEVLQESERAQTARSLARYVASDTREVVRDVVRGLKVEEPEEKLITVLFTDIVKFSTMCERLHAREVVRLLNAYFDQMVDVLQAHDAIIDKFIGDAIVARFDSGDPEADALDAVRAALGMLDRLRRHNETTDEPLYIRVGVNSGEVILGNLGCERHRLDYTMIGDNVNIGARLESIAPRMGCLISASTHALVKDRVEVGSPMEFTVKSKEIPVTAYQLVGVKEEP